MKLAAVRFFIAELAACGCRTEEGCTRGRYDSAAGRVSKGMAGKVQTDRLTDCVLPCGNAADTAADLSVQLAEVLLLVPRDADFTRGLVTLLDWGRWGGVGMAIQVG
jgi:hypothetical protein